MDTELIEARMVEAALSGAPCYEFILAAAAANPNSLVTIVTHSPRIALHEMWALSKEAEYKGTKLYGGQSLTLPNGSRLTFVSESPERIRDMLRGSKADIIWFMNGAGEFTRRAAEHSLVRGGRILEGHIR